MKRPFGTWLVLALALTACTKTTNCPTATSGGGEMLREPTTAPASMSVQIGGLDADGRFQNAQVFSGFGCTGENRSPAVSWSGAPAGTQSYALVMHDPDAPTGVGFFHWIVVDLPASTTSLPEGGPVPSEAHELYTDFGQNGYGGPCPPPGTPHRYEITVYALDVPSTGLPTGATGALVRFALREHTLAIGRAVATYGR